MIQKKPVIGITLDLANNSEKYAYAAFPWYAVRQNYADSVIKVGGIPLMLPYQYDTIEVMLSIIDGLIIPGGDEDIHPKFYGQEFTCDRTATNDQRDNFELLLTQKALEKNMPFLGICRGMQMLNVVCGGNLIQHIPDYIKSQAGVATAINHEQPAPKHTLSHSITIEPNTILANLSGNKQTCMVNSSHHQAVGKIGEGLRVAATAPDGIIEAIESINHKFVIGVEWHPEYLNPNDLDLNLFKGLIEATAKPKKF